VQSAELSMPSTRFLAAVPQFTVDHLVFTAEYYRDVLGFRLEGYWMDPPVFAIVARDDVEVFFNQATEPVVRSRRAGYDMFLRLDGVDALAEELQARGANIIDPPEDRIYGQRELVVEDCNGLILCFGEAISVAR